MLDGYSVGYTVRVADVAPLHDTCSRWVIHVHRRHLNHIIIIVIAITREELQIEAKSEKITHRFHHL